jgi:dTDP-4-dehydrorhamnose 3,5-epimerase-like enzyme
MSRASVEDCRLIELPKILDERGNLTFVEGKRHVPFGIARIFYLYDVPAGASRGAHAHRENHQVLICLAGGLDVEVDDGRRADCFHLDRPSQGLHVPPMIWAAETNFRPGTVCLVLTSHLFEEADYIRERSEYESLTRSGP